MPALDRITILKVPAGGTAHFANASMEDLRQETRRDADSGAGSLWVYLPTGSEVDRFSVDTIQTLKDLSTAVVEQPDVVREVQQALGGTPGRGVEFFTLKNGRDVHRVPRVPFGSDNKPSNIGLRRGGKRSALFSVRWSDPKVPLSELWDDFRKALGVSTVDPSHAMSRNETARRLSSVRAAIELRNAFIARGWPTSAQVGMANGSGSTTNPAQWASDRRDAGALLGAWSPQERTYRHPDFQFDKDGRLKPAVKELLAALATHVDLTARADKTGWRRVFWMYGTVRDLADQDGALRSPAEVFAADPTAVIEFAYKDAAVDVNDVW